MLSLYFTFIFFITTLLYVVDFHSIAYHAIESRYRRFRRLNSLVATQYNTVGMILWISLKLLWKALVVQFFQLLNHNLKRIDKNTYELSYVVNGKLYKMIVKPKRGPRNIIQVTDDEDNDVTDEIHAYLGPCENFHGEREVTPHFFNKDKLVFYFASGDEVVIERHSKIEI